MDLHKYINIKKLESQIKHRSYKDAVLHSPVEKQKMLTSGEPYEIFTCYELLLLEVKR